MEVTKTTQTASSATTITPEESKLVLVKIAKVISLLLHPFLVSPLAIVLILWLDRGDLLEALAWAGLCAAFVVLPGILYLKRKLRRQEYTDADVSVREHRYGFYAFGGTCMAACFATLIWLDAPSVLIAGFSAALVALVVASIINRFWTKVSIHASAVVGVAAAAAFYSIELAVILVLAAIAVSWARLVLKRHTVGQAITAWVVAISSVVIVFGALR